VATIPFKQLKSATGERDLSRLQVRKQAAKTGPTIIRRCGRIGERLMDRETRGIKDPHNQRTSEWDARRYIAQEGTMPVFDQNLSAEPNVMARAREALGQGHGWRQPPLRDPIREVWQVK
jgi:hypothetical protein